MTRIITLGVESIGREVDAARELGVQHEPKSRYIAPSPKKRVFYVPMRHSV